MSDEFKKFFAKFGEIEEHQIMRDHTSGRSRGFGFIGFSSENVVDELLTKGNRIEFAGAQVGYKVELFSFLPLFCAYFWVKISLLKQSVLKLLPW